MKKIVALVLSLVMVLGLATTAFAAPTPAYYGDEADLTIDSGCDLAANKYSLEKYTDGADVAKTFGQVAIWATDKTTGAKTMVATAVVAADAASADMAFVDGSKITYLNTTATTWTDKLTAVKVVKVADAAKCGDVFVGGDLPMYTDAAGVLYTAGTTAYNVGGKVVLLDAATENVVTVDDLDTLVATDGEVYTVAHTYDYDVKTVNAKSTITRVYCVDCKKDFAFVVGTAADAVAKFGAGNYEVVTLGGETVYVAVSAGAVADAEGDKVESAETFDAGIAMYVGMSVMAAAGSAVVLKKKD